MASTIVTATLTAVLTGILFPDGFLVDTAAASRLQPDPPEASADRPESVLSRFGLRASVSCALEFGDVGETGGPEGLP